MKAPSTTQDSAQSTQLAEALPLLRLIWLGICFIAVFAPSELNFQMLGGLGILFTLRAAITNLHP